MSKLGIKNITKNKGVASLCVVVALVLLWFSGYVYNASAFADSFEAELKLLKLQIYLFVSIWLVLIMGSPFVSVAFDKKLSLKKINVYEVLYASLMGVLVMTGVLIANVMLWFFMGILWMFANWG